MTTGGFITFEGGEGAGKTTQIERLTRRLQASGKTVLALREPGGTPLGEAIRSLLKNPPGPLCAEAELALFIAARAQLVRDVIRPALEKGTIVLCDRFLDSTIVYQGISRGLSLETVETLNDFAVGPTRPHLTFFLDLPAEIGLERAKNRGEATDPLEQEPLAFHEKVRKGYHQLAHAQPNRFMILNAQDSVEVLETAIGAQVETFFKGMDYA